MKTRSDPVRVLGDPSMGRFFVEFEVANSHDVDLAKRKKMKATQVRRQVIEGLADPGAAWLVLPKKVVDKLGLTEEGTIKVSYADSRRATRSTVIGVQVTLLGRTGTFNAVVEPKRDHALIGAIILETLDLLVDCNQQRLIPRDPNTIVSEIG